MTHTLRPIHAQRGTTLLVVLVLLVVMLLGGLSMSRMSSVSNLVAGNVSYKERALQVSEIGVNAAFAAVSTSTFPNHNDIANWYFATPRAIDADGIPIGVNLDQGAQVVPAVGGFDVRYVVERMCSLTNVTDPLRQCLMRLDTRGPRCASPPTCPDVDPPGGMQFRITVQVTGPQGARTIVQSLVTAS
jgi:type IV pilus assembly protein PilX